ncbi:acetolactate synthase [Magnetovibrio blakemorei]|uniref:Acetolactate synthase n=2 Tax=Magnetovibrio blakemorei TaxID=28181 RepID=A0A1E5QC08_9PROT|nr:acetolactate synthase [Magnetovibrio blakemorei]
MKLSDYVAQKVVELGIEHVFMVTGGGAMHLNQSFGTHADLECIFNHHEQACAMAAEAYSRLTNLPALVNVTSGPGCINALNGVYGAWTDSISMLVISGQVKYQTTIRSTGLALRQFGDQEVDIERIASPLTKYCEMVTDPKSIRYHLEKAFYLAVSGRPGPCWLDIPIDVQGAQIETDDLSSFDPSELDEPWNLTDLDKVSDDIFAKVLSAHRPVIFVGAGVRLSGHHEDFIHFIDKLGIPVVTGWNAHDSIWSDHPLYVGRPGSVGDRPGNFVVQNADLLLVLGSRLNIRQVSYNWSAFASKAYKIIVDIDAIEMKKPTVNFNMRIHANLSDLLPVLAKHNYAGQRPEHIQWLAWCKERQKRYPVVLPEYWENEKINPYCFMDILFKNLDDGQIVVAANGSACVIGFQVAQLKPTQRLWTNSGSASMGYEIPAAIGAFKGSGGRPIVCIAGDGSIMMNLQELQTIAGNQLDIKVFLLNNQGYSSIFQTHRNFFNGVEVGAGPSSGVNFPDFKKLSYAFDLPYLKCTTHEQMADTIIKTLATTGPAICEIMIDENQPFAPKLSSKQLADGTIVSPSLEDMSPILSEAELNENMLD